MYGEMGEMLLHGHGPVRRDGLAVDGVGDESVLADILIDGVELEEVRADGDVLRDEDDRDGRLLEEVLPGFEDGGIAGDDVEVVGAVRRRFDDVHALALVHDHLDEARCVVVHVLDRDRHPGLRTQISCKSIVKIYYLSSLLPMGHFLAEKSRYFATKLQFLTIFADEISRIIHLYKIAFYKIEILPQFIKIL